MGFANFYVELLDVKKGGMTLGKNDGWVKLATLKFDLIQGVQPLQIVWGRENKSAEYATAFVEIAEWQQNQRTRAVEITSYIDYDFAPESGSLDEGVLVKIGPNPSTDLVHISFDKSIASNVEVNIQTISGQRIKSFILPSGIQNHNVDVSELRSASYLMMLLNSDTKEIIYSGQLVVTQ